LIVSSLTRLVSADDFSSVFNFKKRYFGKFITCFYRPNNLQFSRFGFIVSKKINKKAVRRNYMKRVLKELLRESSYHPSLDIVIQVKKEFFNHHFLLIQAEINEFLEKHV
jgi:ribonuclease P protein component